MARDAVVYLSWWKNHAQWSAHFLRSIVKYNSGAEFDLIYLLKEFPDGETDAAFERYRGQLTCPTHVFRTPDKRFDLNVYLEAAAKFDFGRMLFLNSYSRILAPDWFAHFQSAFDQIPDAGVIAATGSYETMPPLPFPNVNVRTNAFMIDRALLLDLEPGSLETKRDTNRLEAGANSITRQIVRRGMAPVLVDRFGKAWRSEDWPVSRTFRSGHQEGLLIADNRTHHYEAGSMATRRKLAKLAWGSNAVVLKKSVVGRALSHSAWKWPDLVQNRWSYG